MALLKLSGLVVNLLFKLNFLITFLLKVCHAGSWKKNQYFVSKIVIKMEKLDAWQKIS